MGVLKTVYIVFAKILTSAVLVFTIPHAPIQKPTTLTLPPWELPGKARIATTTLPHPAPLITTVKVSNTPARPASSKPATSTPSTTSKPTLPKAPVVTVTPPPVVASTPVVVAPPTESTSDLNVQTRNALVNVLCITGTGGYIKPISGTGVIIDPRGVVLTNAHIAQFFLLRDYPSKNNIQCVLRTGSPAEAMYTAELLYFPKNWLDVNAKKIIQENPTGTGEHDFALLIITGRTNPAAILPTSFPYLEPYIGDAVAVGQSVLLAGYPAGFLQGATIATDLYSASALASIRQIFTFQEGGGADLISVGGTILSQKGSSGGAVVRTDNKRIEGLIVTATLEDTTSQRDLRAITFEHINKSVIENIGIPLPVFLSGDLRAKADTFNITTVPTLSKILIDVLNSR